MKIFKVERPQDDNINYDEFDAHIVVANSWEEALEIAIKTGDNGPSPESMKVLEIGNYTGGEKEPFILLSSYNAG